VLVGDVEAVAVHRSDGAGTDQLIAGDAADIAERDLTVGDGDAEYLDARRSVGAMIDHLQGDAPIGTAIEADSAGMETGRRAGELAQHGRCGLEVQDIKPVLPRGRACAECAAVRDRDEGQLVLFVDCDVARTVDAADRVAASVEPRFDIGEDAEGVERTRRQRDEPDQDDGSGGESGANGGPHRQLASARALENCRLARRA